MCKLRGRLVTSSHAKTAGKLSVENTDNRARRSLWHYSVRILLGLHLVCLMEGSDCFKNVMLYCGLLNGERCWWQRALVGFFINLMHLPVNCWWQASNNYLFYEIIQHAISKPKWSPGSPFLLGKRQQCICATPKLGCLPRTNDFESKALAITLRAGYQWFAELRYMILHPPVTVLKPTHGNRVLPVNDFSDTECLHGFLVVIWALISHRE